MLDKKFLELRIQWMLPLGMMNNRFPCTVDWSRKECNVCHEPAHYVLCGRLLDRPVNWDKLREPYATVLRELQQELNDTSMNFVMCMCNDCIEALQNEPA